MKLTPAQKRKATIADRKQIEKVAHQLALKMSLIENIANSDVLMTSTVICGDIIRIDVALKRAEANQ